MVTIRNGDTRPNFTHPAKFSAPVLDLMREVLGGEVNREPYATDPPFVVLDPFAGVGKIHELAGMYGCGSDGLRQVVTRGVELEPEWAACHEDTEVGDALVLDGFDTGSVDAVFTSPCYGNRMADHHEARDTCKACAGLGVVGPLPASSTSAEAFEAGAANEGTRCPTCKGAGLSKRNTYRHQLGRMPTPGSAAVEVWGFEYRRLHERAVDRMLDVTTTDGLLVINMSNHLTNKGRTEHLVTEWWVQLLLNRGCRLVRIDPIGTRRQRQGANRHRVEHEFLIVVRTPSTRRLL